MAPKLPTKGDRFGELCGEYEQFNVDNGLDLGSADEHLHDESLTPEQQAWIRDFYKRWMAIERDSEGAKDGA